MQNIVKYIKTLFKLYNLNYNNSDTKLQKFDNVEAQGDIVQEELKWKLEESRWC